VGGYLVDSLVALPFVCVGFFLDGPTADPATGESTVGGPLYWLMALVAFLVSGYNRWFLAGRTGQSWGRKALGITLLDEQTGQPIGAGKAFLRDLAHFVDSVICYIGWLFPLWDAKRQTIADKIVRTVVVSA
jgi:uncharacterized RDD family membrane protein YckC